MPGFTGEETGPEKIISLPRVVARDGRTQDLNLCLFDSRMRVLLY